jgi:NADP-dependent 3-hydroxy acid dehydrogenase YdfG
LAYQYALKRASLALVARRESSLRQVADRALLGDVIVLPGDVSAPDDCNRFVQTAISHYDRCECMRLPIILIQLGL